MEGTNTDGPVARAEILVAAPIGKVWGALINPKAIKQYMLGADAVSEWKEGSPIVWKGEWNSKKYEDKGRILRLVPERILSYSHFSPLVGLPDVPENYHTVTVELSSAGEDTLVSLSQTNNPTPEALKHNEDGWRMMLNILKKYVESS